MENQPSFYAIIPANVRYDKRLKANAKLLYGEITSLCNKEGYCWASNRHFADLYEVSITSISLWIKDLVDCGYVKSVTEAVREGEFQRLLFLAPLEENLKPPLRKLKGPLEENLKVNNIYNIKNNKSIGSLPAEGEPIEKVRRKRLTKKASKILTRLNILGNKPRGFRQTKNNHKNIIARLNEGFTVKDCLQVLETKIKDPYFQDNPAYFNPETLFRPKNFEKYLNEDPTKYNNPKGNNRSGVTNHIDYSEKQTTQKGIGNE